MKKILIGAIVFIAAAVVFIPGFFFYSQSRGGNFLSGCMTSEKGETPYVRQLEETLTELIGSIEGAGRTKVAVTLDASAETVYALDETDGGENGQRQLEHILVDTREGQDALVEMTWEPVIRGIAVVCEGADDVTVNAQITQAVSVLTGVSTNRISISKMS